MRIEPTTIFTKIVTLAGGIRTTPHLSGVGARTFIGSTLLYNLLGNPWLGFVDLSYSPLNIQEMDMLVGWLMGLRPQLVSKGLLLARPREPGMFLELQLDERMKSFQSNGWLNREAAISLLLPDWRSMGGVERVSFLEIKQMEGLELHRRDQAHRLWVRTFEGESALLLAWLSNQQNLTQLLKELLPDQRIVFQNALKLANLYFVMDLTADYDLAEYFPTVNALLTMTMESQDRLRLLSQFVVDLYHSDERRYRRFYARVCESSWLAAGWLPMLHEFVSISESFRQQMLESDPKLSDEELEIAWRSWCRFQDMSRT